ncbi:MAG: Holliday junction branch migration protein RuvA [Firmicutes bacterium]|nr:Holliday junction branch migration protein RuvA [Bacillota bacterium]
MYAYIHGILDEVENQRVILDVHGIGYTVSVPTSIIPKLPPLGDKVKLFTYFHIKEDGQELYGFIEKEEKLFFEKLIKVSGIGPKVALGMLSAFSSKKLAIAIVTSDIKLLCTAPGIGKKTAERLILELKDKVGNEAIYAHMPMEHSAFSNERLEALEALQALGYPAVDAERALVGLDATDPSILVRLALKNMGNRGR